MPMSRFGGYAGKVIKIDLTTKTVTEYPWSDTERRLFLGGKIMAAKIIYDNIHNKIDPYGEENMLVITTGPFTNNGVPSTARFNVSGVSPQTGLMASSNCGGNFGGQMKRCGFDGIILVGKCADKTLIKIVDDKITFEDASSLWGLTTGATQEKIGGRCGKLVIGPAGENQVKFAGLFSDERTAGRAGLGGVLGSKNVKAITAQGTKGNNAFDKKKLLLCSKNWTKRLIAHPLTGSQLPRLGSAGLVSQMQAKHILATKNFSKGTYCDFEKVSGERLAEDFLIKNKGCLTCPIQCTRVVSVDGKDVKGPELETLGLLGPNILNNDMDAILKWNYELDELGMDTISCAGTLAFAMELKEKGMADLGLEFGKIDNISSVLSDIAYRRGFGDELAEGNRWLSEKYGGKDFAINVKGLELSAYEPRHAVGMGLGYATSNRGGCHLNGGYLVILEGLGLNINQLTTCGKAAFTNFFQDFMEAISAAGSCLFTSYQVFPGFLISKPNFFVTKIVNGVAPYIGGIVNVINHHPGFMALNLESFITYPVAIKHCVGMKSNIGEFLKIGKRGYNLERLVNIRLGLQGSQDRLPNRLTTENEEEGNNKTHVPMDKLIKKYYKSRKWDENGVPKPSLIKYLKIDEKAFKKEVVKDEKIAKKLGLMK
ncbi:MAG: aldehyde ferredoxin oxidoreductase family protein [Clostridia bacterium]